MTSSVSLDAVLQLLQQLNLKLDGLKDQVTALQNVPATKSRTKPSSTTPVGMGANGQQEKKYPINTLAWIKQECAANPAFFKTYIGDYYDKLAARHAEELKNENQDVYHVKLGEKIWKDLKTLCASSDPETKQSSSQIVENLSNHWRAGKISYQATHPSSVVATPVEAPEGGLKFQTPQLPTLPLDTPLLAQSLIPPMSFQLPVMSPVGVSALNLKA